MGFSAICFIWKTSCTNRKVDRGWQIYFVNTNEILEILRLTIEIEIAPFCSLIRTRTHFPPMLNVWVTEGIKKWFGPLRETPPFAPRQVPSLATTTKSTFYRHH